ncbi:MAG TPA: glycosyltransferase family 1 protein [Nitrospirae bacterium]|nr:glycosyltransferase family 1 protein [Nitrospirota bacterium]
MRILFITHPYPNYVPDLLLHGLRKLLQNRVIDYPKKDCLYQGCLGTGVSDESLLVKGWFPDDNDIDREDIKNKIRKDYFKYIIVDLRAFSYFFKNLYQGDLRSLLVLIDGEDIPQRISPGPYVICQRETDGSDFSIPLPMAIPEEIMQLIYSYDTMEKKYSIGFLGSYSPLCYERKNFIETIATHFPDSLLKTTPVPTDDNPMPQGRIGRIDYYKALQQCKVVLNIKGAGFDTFRFWENFCCNAVHLSQRMPLFIPHDFQENKDFLSFSTATEMITNVRKVLDGLINDREMILSSRERMIKYHLTTHRATYLLNKLKGYK